MAEQAGAREHKPYTNQPLGAGQRREQNPPMNQSPRIAPSESFGPFGPLPDFPESVSANNQPSAPVVPASFMPPSASTTTPNAPGVPIQLPMATAPVAPASFMPLKASTTAPNAPGVSIQLPMVTAPVAPASFMPPKASTIVPNAPGVPVRPSVAAASAAPLPPSHYAPSMPGAASPAYYGPRPVIAKKRKPIHFPLTRQAPALLQIFGMLLYSLVMALGIMGCILMLLRASIVNTSIYLNANQSIDGLSVLVTLLLALLLVPACSLFSGTFFGSWRGVLVSILSVGGGLLIAHITDYRFEDLNATPLTYLPLAALPCAALVVGLVYERRRYAAWWKSMLTMFLGVATLTLWLSVSIYIDSIASGNLAVFASSAHMTQQSYLMYLVISLGFISLLAIPLLGLFFAGIEGLIHSVLARVQPGR